ncbi:MAG: polysaccharide biosynthesis protein [Desulfobacteraceae bacterium]|nr:polysaccharide biosynthesis protein [Desulfobacteraceae bacterium]
MLADYEYLATGRKESLFSEDMEKNCRQLDENIHGSRIAIIGAAGSVAFSVVKNILQFNPGSLTLIDLSENNLVEVVRELRSSGRITVLEDFTVLPIGLGSAECTRFFRESEPFDYILNFSAIKHVRSEKNSYCLVRMIDTNVLFPTEFLESIPYNFRKFFSVSSDKATNPANLMGASKMVMEKALLHLQKQVFSTARFANVAFSDGSLLYGFLKRIEKRQPISAPKDVKRYFMSHEEAGQICLLSCILGENGDVYFPKLKTSVDEKTFLEIALKLLVQLGYEPYKCSSEDEAIHRAEELLAEKKWPCYFSISDTTGEKSHEEFYSQNEVVDLNKYQRIGVIKQSVNDIDEKAIKEFIQFAQRARSNGTVKKSDYVFELQKVVPGLRHIETGKNLDQKM